MILVWSAPISDGGTPITEYEIYRGENQTTLGKLTTVSSRYQTYEDMSVESGATYYYRILARNAIGASAMSEMASVTIPPQKETTSVLWPAAASAALVGAVSAAAILMRRKDGE